MTLEGELIRLRAVEPEDAELIHTWENDPDVWAVSGTTEPFSHEQIRQFVERQLQGGDLFRTGQLRLMIEVPEAEEAGEDGSEEGDGKIERTGEPGEASGISFRTIGTIDLFEYDPLHGRAGLGILIYDAEQRGRGYAADAVETLCRYAREGLRMHQLWCCVGTDNAASLRLFRKLGFREVGTKRDWLWTPDGYRDEILLQKILK